MHWLKRVLVGAVISVAWTASSVAAAEVSPSFRASPEVGRHRWDILRKERPEMIRQIEERMHARGWRPTDRYSGVVAPRFDRHAVSNGATHKHLINFVTQDQAIVSSGEIDVWYWDTGVSGDVGFSMYVLSYDTGTDVTVEGDTYAVDDWDIDFNTFAYMGGPRMMTS